MILNTNALLPTPHTLHNVEKDLLDTTGGSELIWCGRGATALYLAYRAVSRAHPEAEVILPALSCPIPTEVALLAGLTPRFADVDAQTGLVSLESIQACWTPNTRSVVVVHLFGHTVELRPIFEWCQYQNIILIEDVALALGAHLPDGRPVGSVGDMSIYSFGAKKIVECGGGALSLRSNEWESIIKQDLQQHPLPSAMNTDTTALLELSYRHLQYGLIALLRLGRTTGIAEFFTKAHISYSNIYISYINNVKKKLTKKMENLPSLLEKRYQKAEVYRQRLEGGPWQRLDGWRESGVCWRYCLLVDFPDHVVPFSELVRQDGFHLSNLYWPVNQFFRSDDKCPNADAFSRRIVNLWVDDTVDMNWVNQCIDSLWKNSNKFT